MQFVDPLLTEKTKYKKVKFLYEIWFTFAQFNVLLKSLLIFFVVGLIPVYFVGRFLYYGVSLANFSSIKVEAMKPTVLGSDLIVGPGEVLVAGDRTYSAYAELTNPNLDLAAPFVSYEFVLFGTTGEEIERVVGQTYLLNNEKKSIILPRLDSETPITKAELHITETKFVKRLNIPVVDLAASTPDFYNQAEPPAFVVEGQVFNNSPYSLKTINLKYLLYDFQGNLLAISQRREDSLDPFERRAYKQIWPNIYSEKIAHAVVETETNVLDRHNLRLQDF